MKPISLTAAEFICLNMREADRIEVFGLRNHDDPLLLAREVVLAASYGHAAISERNGKPTGIIGCTPLWSGVWSIFSFGTDDWPRSVIELSRYGHKVIRPFILNRGGHRAQCESYIDHTDAHRWLNSMGAECDGVLPGYGKDGKPYLMFSWRR